MLARLSVNYVSFKNVATRTIAPTKQKAITTHNVVPKKQKTAAKCVVAPKKQIAATICTVVPKKEKATALPFSSVYNDKASVVQEGDDTTSAYGSPIQGE